jgi:glycerophosphoryl diester phosphodiesterase
MMKKTITRFIIATVVMMFSLNASAQQQADTKPGKNTVKPVTLPEAGTAPQLAAPQTFNTGIPDMPLPKPILPNMPADVNSKTPVVPEIKKPAPVSIDQHKKQAIVNR